jgi:hypothetical protein
VFCFTLEALMRQTLSLMKQNPILPKPYTPKHKQNLALPKPYTLASPQRP